MPKRKKGSRADTAKSSAARSKKSYSVYLDDDLRAELRTWPKAERGRIGRLIRRVQENFGGSASAFRIRHPRPVAGRKSSTLLRMSYRSRVETYLHTGKAILALLPYDRHPRRG